MPDNFRGWLTFAGSSQNLAAELKQGLGFGHG
jgi:hypothetical protein